MSNLPTKVITIAGLDAGIRVNVREELYPVYVNIQTLARQNNHWASLCVRQIESLTSGQVKKNVFIQNNGISDDLGEYSMILPGCRASFRKTSKGEFYIYSLVADSNYADLQSDAEKPGLFNVTKQNQKWSAEFVADGKITERKINVVAITDQSRGVEDTAMLAPDAIADSGRISGGLLTSNGFDLHFTPGGSKIGGLRNLPQARNADTDPNLHQSAILLAETMKAARNIKDVAWVSERGGSGVLTQAMQILKDDGVNFEGSGHVAFFSHITTNLAKADQLARAIGIKFDGNTHKKDFFNVNESLGSGFGGGFVAIWKRDRKDGKFSDFVAEVKSHKDVYDTATKAVPATVVACYTKSTVAAAALKVFSSATAFSTGGLVMAAAVSAYAVGKGGNAVVKSYFPLQHKHLQNQLQKLLGKS